MGTPLISPRWTRGLRYAVPVVGLAAVAAVHPEIVTGTFSGPASVGRVGLLVVGWFCFSRLVRRFVHPVAARTAVLGVAGLALLWMTVVPYFQEKSVDDGFPAPAVAAPAVAAPAAAAPAAALTAAAATEPRRVASGPLHGLAGHRGSGEAVLYRQADGSLLVRLEDFEVSNVPAPVLYVVAGGGKERPGDGIHLGALRGSQGNQNFIVPPGAELDAPLTVLIWCERFSVPVAAATAKYA